MKRIDSMVVGLDGETKAGKTEVIRQIEIEALYQKGLIPEVLCDDRWATILRGEYREGLEDLQEALAFTHITRVIAGNAFRAAALQVIWLEKAGKAKTEFDTDDADTLREMVADPDLEDALQHDLGVRRRVASVAKMAGAQTVCGTIVCDLIDEAYHADGGSNLVIVDARDPVGHMRRRGLIGIGQGQIHPGSILPIYVDTPVEVAAARMKGNLSENIAEISTRRLEDATRAELPVVRPEHVINDLVVWMRQFGEPQPRTDVAEPFYLNNDETMRLENIQYFAGLVAATAQDAAYYLRQSRQAA